MARVSVSPQAQVRVSTPSVVQVAGVVTVHAPKAWVWSPGSTGLMTAWQTSHLPS